MTDSQPSQEHEVIDILDNFAPNTFTGSLVSKPKKTRSKVYEHYTWNNETQHWLCKYCRSTFATPKHGGTGSLVNHLNRTHPSVKLTEGPLIEAKNSVSSFLTSKSAVEAWKNVVINAEEFRSKLAQLIVCSDQSFAFVEDPKFRELILYCSKGDQAALLPSAKTAKKLVKDMYDKEKSILVKQLQENDSKISFTIDCWTSSNQYPFQEVVANWINKEWELCSFVIDLTIIEGSHTGVNIATVFSNVLNEFDLWPKFLGLTTDNASNMDTMFVELESLVQINNSRFSSKDHRVRCLAHILNLSCRAIIGSIGDDKDEPSENEDSDVEDEDMNKKENTVIGKLRKAVVSIRGSPQRRELFAKQCRVAGTDPKNLIRDVRTRWNSTLDMLERAIMLKEPLEITLQSIKPLRKWILTEDEWGKAKSLVTLLEPFKEATIALSNQHSPTISKATSIYQVLFDHLEANMQQPGNSRSSQRTQLTNIPIWLSDAASAGWQKLKKYYPSSDGLVYIVSTVLDPRYKLQWYGVVKWRQEWITASRRAITDLWNRNYKPKDQDIVEDEPNNEPPPKNSMFDDIFKAQMQSVEKSNQDDELRRHLSDSVVKSELLETKILDGKSSGINGTLGWWKIHQNEYPNLSKMAKDFLAVPGTGVPVERLFSTGPDLLSHRRQSLKPQAIKECLRLKNWLKNKDCVDEIREETINAIQNKIYGK